MTRHSRTRPPRMLERLDFADGAALLSRDLVDLATYEARLLGLHVRGMHDVAGVAEGLRFTVAADGRSVVVAPGAAYTSCGEVIALHRPVTVAGPRRATPGAARSRFILALGAPAPTAAAPCERGARCTGAPSEPRVPTLRWVPTPPAADTAADALLTGDEIPLGAVVRRSDGVLETVDYADRQVVRPLSRPHMGFDTRKAGSLSWSPTLFPLRAYVDTRAAGFSTTPMYFASLGPVAGLPATLLGPFVSIEQPSASGFTLRVLFVNRPAQPASAIAELVHSRLAEADVYWTGLETVRGCSSTGGTT